ncbi:hypothetical protein FRB95_014688 [Tulasnella sp. JGI-2019a]|nr:hypothetical protein FRB93_011971 [Tulasnella sp. JGI-2019a]KAG9033509.1 hypothetical protein FRB95_014688 [Tulasnella sp. JGI-2019a]
MGDAVERDQDQRFSALQRRAPVSLVQLGKPLPHFEVHVEGNETFSSVDSPSVLATGVPSSFGFIVAVESLSLSVFVGSVERFADGGDKSGLRIMTEF